MTLIGYFSKVIVAALVPQHDSLPDPVVWPVAHL